MGTMRVGLALGMGLLVATGCGDAGWEPDQGEGDAVAEAGDESLGTTTEAVTGVITTSGCTAAQQQLAINGINVGRVVAASGAYTQCVAFATNVGKQLSNFGGLGTFGPYKPVAGDPFGNLSWAERFPKILYATRHPTNVSLKCDNAQEGNIAEAFVGSYRDDREASESLVAGVGFQGWVNESNGQNSSVADFYQPAHAKAANGIWHEALHQWGYSHVDASLNTSAPYIAATCMESIALASATCPNVCLSGQRPVRSVVGNANCTCVDDPQFDVGVIPATAGACPTNFGQPDPELTIYMDDEDTDNANSKFGWIGAFTSNSNTTMRFCRAPGRLFKRPLTASYAVLRMGASCPSGSVPFNRYFDNEDDENVNSSTGHIAPSSSNNSLVSSGTRLQFCLFNPSASGSDTLPDLGVQYGVFASTLFPALASGRIYTDDEDTDNTNSLAGSYVGSEGFLSVGKNTTLRLARVR